MMNTFQTASLSWRVNIPSWFKRTAEGPVLLDLEKEHGFTKPVILRWLQNREVLRKSRCPGFPKQRLLGLWGRSGSKADGVWPVGSPRQLMCRLPRVHTCGLRSRTTADEPWYQHGGCRRGAAQPYSIQISSLLSFEKFTTVCPRQEQGISFTASC